MAKAAPSRTRRSKPEVQKEFSKIVDEFSDERESSDLKIVELATLGGAGNYPPVGGILVGGVGHMAHNLWP